MYTVQDLIKRAQELLIDNKYTFTDWLPLATQLIRDIAAIEVKEDDDAR